MITLVELIIIIIGCVATVIIGVIAGFFKGRRSTEKKYEEINGYYKKIINEAHRKAKTIKKEAMLKAKDTIYQLKNDLDKEAKEKNVFLKVQEKRLIKKEESLDKKIGQYENRENHLFKREKNISKTEEDLKNKSLEYDNLVKEQRIQLEKVAGITSEDAKKLLVMSMESEAKHDAAKHIRRIENEARETSKKKAQEIIALAVKRYAGDYVSENTVSVVALPNEEMKGRIIGREGRNIRAIEAATGISLIVDDTPEAVILSGFNPVRREIAKISLQRLIEDGRIHPARIEEIVKKVEKEIEASIKEAGEQATFDVGVHGIDPEIIKLIGRLKYRSSYAQNVLQHSREVSFICGVMASELGVNVKKAKRAGLLHDIGKAVDHEVEGPHALIGADLAKKYREPEDVIHAIQAHHEDIPPDTIMAVLTQAADTLSGARPGARREMLESYIKRLEDLEKIAMSFNGVSKSFAIQAGREIRILVEGDQINDDQSTILCKDIAGKIEKELTYPGQIKVTVIRETRAVDYAK